MKSKHRLTVLFVENYFTVKLIKMFSQESTIILLFNIADIFDQLYLTNFLIFFSEDLETLKNLRENNERKSNEVVAIWENTIDQNNLDSLGVESMYLTVIQ